jgi:hypothetical protein
MSSCCTPRALRVASAMNSLSSSCRHIYPSEASRDNDAVEWRICRSLHHSAGIGPQLIETTRVGGSFLFTSTKKPRRLAGLFGVSLGR